MNTMTNGKGNDRFDLVKSTDSTELGDEQLAAVSGGIEQVLNIGSQSSGAGAGKVTFNPFSVTRA